MKPRSLLVLLVFAPSCGSPAPADVDTVTADLTPPNEPRGLAKLGVVEQVLGAPHAGLSRALNAAGPALDACLRQSLDRDPSLQGALVFQLEIGAAARVERVAVTGDLRELPSAECARKALSSLSVSGAAPGASFRYALELSGEHRPAKLPPDAPELRRSLTSTAASTGWMHDASVDAPFAAKAGALQRCILGAGGPVPVPTWIVLRAERDGTVKLEPLPAGEEQNETALCLRRTIEGMRLPATTSARALSALIGVSGQKPFPEERDDVAEFGMVGLINSGAAGDGTTAKGNMWGDEIGDAFGAGGLGLQGIGEGGGGIGIGTIGTGPGFGSGGGRLGSSKRTTPKIKAGATDVQGRLPPEVIQRIVRQNFGRFRLCYENALRTKPKLQGTVRVSFTIDPAGNVSAASGGGDLPDAATVSCVSRAFYNLSFPKPETGVVKVTYPIRFMPSDEDAAAPPAPLAPPPPPTIDKKRLDAVDSATLARVLRQKGFGAREVPGANTDGELSVVFARNLETDEIVTVRIAPTYSDTPWCSLRDGARAVVVRGNDCEAVVKALKD